MIIKSSKSGGYEFEFEFSLGGLFIRVPGLFEAFTDFRRGGMKAFDWRP